MRKFSLVLLMAFVLVLGFTMTVWAAAEDEGISTKVYFDNWVGAKEDVSNNIVNAKVDTQCTFLGFELNANQIKFGAEFGINASVKANPNLDYNMSNFKIGFRVVDAEQAKLDVIVSSMKFDGDYFTTNGGSCTGTMLGADLTYALTEQLFCQASYSFSLDASWGNFDSVDMSALNLKVGDSITENIAITAGYRLYRIDTGSGDLNLKGMTLGAMVRF